MFNTKRLGALSAPLRSILDRIPAKDTPYSNVLRAHRRWVTAAIYAVLSATSFALAFVLRFELSPVDRSPAVWSDWFLGSVGVVVALRVATAELLGLHRASWRYVGVRDVLPTLLAVGIGSVLAAPVLMGVLLVQLLDK